MQNTLGKRTRRTFRRGYWKFRQALSAARFNETFYLSAYPDVAKAVENGEYVVSGFHHYAITGAAEGRVPVAPVRFEPSVDLTAMPTTALVYLELTTRCNLRCVYCPVSQPNYWNVDFDPAKLDRVLADFQERRVRVVQLNGHGESSIVKEWDSLADRLADSGYRVRIVTNLAKRLTPSEIAALSRFEQIWISIDTVDDELLGRLRRGANIQTIFDNLASVQSYAAGRHRKPEIAISSVVSLESAPGISGLVDEFLSRGVRVFRFGDLVEYPAVEGAMVARHLSRAAEEELDRLGAGFAAALERIAAAGGQYHVDPPITALLIERSRRSAFEDFREGAPFDKKVHHDIAGADQTRDCLDPWDTLYVHATGAVRPCCFLETHLGVLGEQSLSEIADNPEFRALRRGLLDGNLPAGCATCHARPLIDRDSFREKVTRYVKSQT